MTFIIPTLTRVIPLITHEQIQVISALYEAQCGAWLGCDWHTRFGSLEVDLRKLRSQQTRLLSEATSGEESRIWEEATDWLRQVELDAQAAETAASEAVQLVRNRDFSLAETRIAEAVNLEAKYRTSVVWGPLATFISKLHQSELSSNNS